MARLSRYDAAELLVDTERPDAEELRGRAMALIGPAEGGVGRGRGADGDSGRVDVLGPLVGTEDVAASWAALDTDRQRAVVATLARVVLLPPGPGTRTFRTETVEIIPRR